MRKRKPIRRASHKQGRKMRSSIPPTNIQYFGTTADQVKRLIAALPESEKRRIKGFNVVTRNSTHFIFEVPAKRSVGFIHVRQPSNPY
jgi:hypothetical protein